MITRVQIKNFRSIESVDVNLEAMTVLVGRNGSGKSSFVDAIKFVRDALKIGLENAVVERHGFGNICRHSSRRKRQIEITIFLEGKHFSGFYYFVLGSNKGGFKIVREGASCRTRDYDPFSEDDSDPYVRSSFERNERNWVSAPTGEYFVPRNGEVNLESTVLALPALALFDSFNELLGYLSGDFYTIFPNTLRQPQKPMNEKILSDYGDNFISVLQHVIRDKSSKKGMLAVLSRVVEGVSDVRVRSAAGFLVAELQHQDLFSEGLGDGKTSAPWFDLSQESDGTLRMLGLLTALYQGEDSDERRLLALEEPEIALHPGALAILADELKATSQHRQLLVTTQSPDMITRFEAKDLRVVERVNGVTQIGPIEESQRKVIEDQLFNAGDLLRIEGLRGARPTETDEALAA
jgi:predicted ATPase